MFKRQNSNRLQNRYRKIIPIHPIFVGAILSDKGKSRKNKNSSPNLEYSHSCIYFAVHLTAESLNMGNVQAVPPPPHDVVPTFDPKMGFPKGRKERGKSKS